MWYEIDNVAEDMVQIEVTPKGLSGIYAHFERTSHKLACQKTPCPLSSIYISGFNNQYIHKDVSQMYPQWHLLSTGWALPIAAQEDPGAKSAAGISLDKSTESVFTASLQ